MRGEGGDRDSDGRENPCRRNERVSTEGKTRERRHAGADETEHPAVAGEAVPGFRPSNGLSVAVRACRRSACQRFVPQLTGQFVLHGDTR